MNPSWFNVLGLLLDLCGIVVFFFGIYIPRAELRHMIAEVRSVGTLGGGGPDRLMKDRVRSIKIGAIGSALLVAGFIFQLIGSWPRV